MAITLSVLETLANGCPSKLKKWVWRSYLVSQRTRCCTPRITSKLLVSNKRTWESTRQVSLRIPLSQESIFWGSKLCSLRDAGVH